MAEKKMNTRPTEQALLRKISRLENELEETRETLDVLYPAKTRTEVEARDACICSDSCLMLLALNCMMWGVQR